MMAVYRLAKAADLSLLSTWPCGTSEERMIARHTRDPPAGTGFLAWPPIRRMDRRGRLPTSPIVLIPSIREIGQTLATARDGRPSEETWICSAIESSSRPRPAPSCAARHGRPGDG
jgi:hypothetical protein